VCATSKNDIRSDIALGYRGCGCSCNMLRCVVAYATSLQATILHARSKDPAGSRPCNLSKARTVAEFILLPMGGLRAMAVLLYSIIHGQVGLHYLHLGSQVFVRASY